MPANTTATQTFARMLRFEAAELRFKPLWLEDLVGLTRNLLKATRPASFHD